MRGDVESDIARQANPGPVIASRSAMTVATRNTRILTAVAPDTIDRVRRILVGHNLLIVTHLADAQATLRTEAIGVVFVGARFDDSRMFDLIDLIRHEVVKKKIPIVAAMVTPTHLSMDAIAGLSHSVKLFGATLFVNLNDFPDDAVGNTRVRLIVDSILLPPETVEKLAPPPLHDTDQA